jgi:hypothetical protein
VRHQRTFGFPPFPLFCCGLIVKEPDGKSAVASVKSAPVLIPARTAGGEVAVQMFNVSGLLFTVG